MFGLAGLANCRYVAHQSDRQGKNAPKGYIERQEMTPEIAHIHIGRLHNGMLWMQSDPSPQNLTIFFSGAHFNQCSAPINATFGQPCTANPSIMSKA